MESKAGHIERVVLITDHFHVTNVTKMQLNPTPQPDGEPMPEPDMFTQPAGTPFINKEHQHLGDSFAGIRIWMWEICVEREGSRSFGLHYVYLRQCMQ